MTVTASATDRDLLGSSELTQYGHLAEGEASYVIHGRLGFDLSLARSGEHWTVTDRETGIHGVGASPSEALADFRTAANEHLDVLERQEALSADLVAQLDYLRARLSD